MTTTPSTIHGLPALDSIPAGYVPIAGPYNPLREDSLMARASADHEPYCACWWRTGRNQYELCARRTARIPAARTRERAKRKLEA